MYEHGVAGTTTEDILQAAGVSNSQLYHYFADKAELTRAVIAYQIVDFRRQRQGGGCPMGSPASELADVNEDARLDLVSGFAQWESAIRNGLAAMRERGELRDDADPDRLALATLAALQGGLLLTQIRRDVAPLQAALDAAIGYIRTFAS
jgi:AcrR family transcriptional regulator